jgi:hypothetical protein
MIQQAYPDWRKDHTQIPEPLVGLLLALVKRDNSIEEAITRRNPYKITFKQGIREATRQLQARLETACSNPAENA